MLLPIATSYLKQCKNKQLGTTRKILKAIAYNSNITRAEIARVTNVSDSTVKRYLKELQETGVIERKGSDTKGEWILH